MFLRFGRKVILLHNYAELLHNISRTALRRKRTLPDSLVTVNTQWSLLPSKTESSQCAEKSTACSHGQTIDTMQTAKENLVKKFSELIVPNTMQFLENCACGKNDFEHAVDHFYATLKSLDHTLKNPNAFICPKLDWIKLILFFKCIESKEIILDRRAPKFDLAATTSTLVVAASGHWPLSW